jgi:hypothetical protein
VRDENVRTEQAPNLNGRIVQSPVLTNCGRNVQPQVITNQPNVLHQNTAFVTNTYPHPDSLRQDIGERGRSAPTIIHQQYTSPVRPNIGVLRQPLPQPKVIQRQPTITYRQSVGDRDTESCSIFSFIGAIIATVCLVAFYILLNLK